VNPSAPPTRTAPSRNIMARFFERCIADPRQ
jgi:hypothetical protein